MAPNSTPPRLVNSQLVSLPSVGILNLLYCKCIVKRYLIVIEIALYLMGKTFSEAIHSTYILLDVLLCSIAENFNELCRILASP